MKGKNEIRRAFILRRQSLEPSFIGSAGGKICFQLDNFKLTVEAEQMAAFHPEKGEPDICGFLKESLKKGKKICFPRFNRVKGDYEMAFVVNFAEDFVEGEFGIPEPKPDSPAVSVEILKNILWLVPGTAFDFKGGRLGYGRGIFDRLLSDASGIKIGICYEWQMISAVPSDEKDVKMDFTVTESGLHRCS
jgi:5-formyltetrahydrofolate cyclo-ligase